MKHRADFVWQQAENIAKTLNTVAKNLEQQNESEEVVKNFNDSLKTIDGDCSKEQFISILTNAAEKVTCKSDNFTIAVRFAVSLPVTAENEDDEYDFSYFMTLVKFLLATF